MPFSVLQQDLAMLEIEADVLKSKEEQINSNINAQH